MKKLTLTALALFSTSALATDARVGAHQGNVAITDDTDYQTYYARTDNGKDSIWFNSNGGTDLTAAYRNDGAALTMSGNPAGTGTSFGIYSADGDTGFGVNADIVGFDAINIGGGYGMSDGKDDMVFFGGLSMVGDSVGFGAGIQNRALTDDDVSVWGVAANYSDAGIGIDGGYTMGWRYKTDRSRGGLTMGPSLGVDMPEGGDAAVSISLADVNLAGEFSLNDWLGLRGSVASGVDLVGLTGDDDIGVSTQMLSPMFGASLDFEGADVDFMIDPVDAMSWPDHGDQFAAMMSARFDI